MSIEEINSFQPNLPPNSVQIYVITFKALDLFAKGWLAIAKLIPLSLIISLLLMPNEAFDNVKIEK